MESPTFVRPEPVKSLEELSTTWCEQLLSYYYKIKVIVKHWNGKSPKFREGYLSELAYVDITYVYEKEEEERNEKLVFKFLPSTKDAFSFVNDHHLAIREIKFYNFFFCKDMKSICQDIRTELPVPEVLYSHMTSNAMTLVMKNLCPEGYSCINPKEGLELTELKVYIKYLAVIHAFGIIFKLRRGSEAMEEILNDPPFNNNFTNDLVKKGFVYLAKLHKGSLRADKLLQWCSQWRYLRDLPWNNMIWQTCCNGDFWTNNVMYNREQGKVKILDWQLGCFGNPVGDISELFLMSTNPTVFEEHLYEILGIYWDSYVNTLKKADITPEGTFTDLMECLEKLWLYGFMMLVASIEDFTSNGAITDSRLLKVVDFMDRKGLLEVPSECKQDTK
ncbi:uncharacterized protein LOC143029088 isoform X2 [Oratosquilla oratoria]|uniref:uncharacterized protein LOC143029088 isoform X2 n=1 Tax=Oratosquilla oratoria TaxID=337810 RepID=UPI003F757B07